MIPTLQGSPSLIQQVAGLSPAAWYRYGMGLTDAGAGACSAWADQSGNGRTLTAAGAARPTIQADNSLLFNGSANILQTAAFTLNQPSTVYLLCKEVTQVNLSYFCDGLAANTRGMFMGGVAGTDLRITAGTGLLDGIPTSGAYAVFFGVFNGASSVVGFNSTSTTGNANTAAASGFSLGGAGGPSNFSNIQVKEVILFAAAHTAAQRSTVISYLGSVGGLGL